MTPASSTVAMGAATRRSVRRASILRAAAAAFSRSGFAATSMDDVAAAACVSKLIVYRHFDTKEELYRAILEDVSGSLRDDFARAVETGGIRGVPARVFMAAARRDPDGFRLLWRHSTRERSFYEYATAVNDAAVAVALRYLEAVVADPTLQTWAAHVVVSHLVEASLLWVDHGEVGHDAEAVERLSASTRAMVMALAAPGAGSGPGS